MSVKNWILAVVGLLVLAVLALNIFEDKKRGKPEAGSDEQLALARKAKAKIWQEKKAAERAAMLEPEPEPELDEKDA